MLVSAVLVFDGTLAWHLTCITATHVLILLLCIVKVLMSMNAPFLMWSNFLTFTFEPYFVKPSTLSSICTVPPMLQCCWMQTEGSLCRSWIWVLSSSINIPLRQEMVRWGACPWLRRLQLPHLLVGQLRRSIWLPIPRFALHCGTYQHQFDGCSWGIVWASGSFRYTVRWKTFD